MKPKISWRKASCSGVKRKSTRPSVLRPSVRAARGLESTNAGASLSRIFTFPRHRPALGYNPRARSRAQRDAATEVTMQISLHGKTALVTGAGRNIGRAIALGMAQVGANVVVHYRSQRAEAEAVAADARRLGVEAIAVPAELADPAAVQRMAELALAKFGKVDILVNNAAVRPRQSFMEITPAMWDDVVRSNLSSAFYCARALMQSMLDHRFGRIVSISGTDGYQGRANRVHNVTCKAGLIGLTKAIAVEMGHHGVTANIVVPGIMNTTRDLRHYPNWPPTQQTLDALPVPRMGEPEEIAHACVYLASDQASYVTGQTIHVSGGWFMP
ncbi:MAG: 3-oxoacyl-ACP reductase FabG [Dehalococcoidia bacterium]|nr:3-oxoacyl-ACP reductase FabG [Dehalococcoidia bacterium]